MAHSAALVGQMQYKRGHCTLWGCAWVNLWQFDLLITDAIKAIQNVIQLMLLTWTSLLFQYKM